MLESSQSKTVSRLFSRLNAEDIRYCHWKSNAHLGAALAGDTDLDLLVDPGQASEFQRICAGEGIKLLPTHPSRAYAEAENLFGVEETTGALLHLDVHYGLIIGQRHFKEYRPPWAGTILDRRVLSDEYQVFTADPESEMLLLIVRSALKIRLRNRPRILFKQGGPSGNLRREFEWLSQRTDGQRLSGLARELLGPEAAGLIERSRQDGLSYRSLLRLRRALRRDLRPFRAAGPVSGTVQRWKREARWAVGGLNRRYLHRPFAYSRGGSSGGLVIAVVGTQGAGKSTITRALNGWLSPKADVLPIYFGSGDGPSSVIRWPMTVAKRWYLRRRRGGSAGTSGTRAPARPGGGIRGLWSLALAVEKRSKLRRMVKGRERGLIVICDRYPQTQEPGLNDGPLLSAWAQSRSPLLRRLAAWEFGIYDSAARLGPDIFVRLLLSTDAALERRPGHDPAQLQHRNEIVKRAYGSARRLVIDVDAETDLDMLLRGLKQRLWVEI